MVTTVGEGISLVLQEKDQIGEVVEEDAYIDLMTLGSSFITNDYNYISIN